MKTEHGTNDSFSKAKHKAYGDLAKLMDNVGNRSLPGGKIAPGHVDEVVVTRKAMPKGKSLTHAVPLDQHPPKEEGPKHEQSEAPKFEDLEHQDGESFLLDRGNPGDEPIASTGPKPKQDLGSAQDVDDALKKFLVKGKKHITKK